MRRLIVVVAVLAAGCGGAQTPEAAPTTEPVPVERTAGDTAACAIFRSESVRSREAREKVEAKGTASGMELSFATTSYRDAASSAMQRAESADLVELLGDAGGLASSAFEGSGDPASGFPAVQRAWAAADSVDAWCDRS